MLFPISKCLIFDSVYQAPVDSWRKITIITNYNYTFIVTIVDKNVIPNQKFLLDVMENRLS